MILISFRSNKAYLDFGDCRFETDSTLLHTIFLRCIFERAMKSEDFIMMHVMVIHRTTGKHLDSYPVYTDQSYPDTLSG